MVAMVLGNADIPSGQGALPANAMQSSTSNLAIMGITGFVATQEIDQMAQTVPGLSEALEKGTVDRDMFKKVLKQLRANEAQKLSHVQGLTQVKTFVDTNKKASESKTLQAELELAKAVQDKNDVEDLLSKGRKVASPSRREMDFSIVVKKRDQTRDYLQKFYCANQPGDAIDSDSDEFKIQDMLLKDPADVDEDLWIVLQRRCHGQEEINRSPRLSAHGRGIPEDHCS